MTDRDPVECRRKLEQRRRQLEADPGATGGGSVTVKAWYETWLEIHATRASPKHYASDASAVRRWIVPTVGSRRIGQLTPADVRSVSRAVRRAGRSATTALRVHGTLVRALKAAVADGYTVPRLAMEVDPPGIADDDRAEIPLEHVQAILAATADAPDRSRWVATFLQGMRQNECLGLTWDRVDLDAGTVDVSWQLQALPYLDRAAETFRVPDGYESRRLVGAFHLVRPKGTRRRIPGRGSSRSCRG